jgi:hypothetical protein
MDATALRAMALRIPSSVTVWTRNPGPNDVPKHGTARLKWIKVMHVCVATLLSSEEASDMLAPRHLGRHSSYMVAESRTDSRKVKMEGGLQQ